MAYCDRGYGRPSWRPKVFLRFAPRDKLEICDKGEEVLRLSIDYELSNALYGGAALDLN
jgi:hypothetical protein